METELTLWGALFIVLVWGGITALTIFCFSRIFKDEPEQIVGPLEVEAEIDAEEHRQE